MNVEWLNVTLTPAYLPSSGGTTGSSLAYAAASSTAVVAGASEVRVGGVRFVVRPGDMYCLAGAARRDVDHEVYAHADDRLSVTFRYGPWDEPHHEAARGDAASDR